MSLEKEVFVVILASLLGFGFTTHPVASIVCDYYLNNVNHLNKLLQEHAAYVLALQQMLPQLYFRYVLSKLANGDLIMHWFFQQQREVQIALFKTFPLNDLIVLLKISSKKRTSFTKALQKIEKDKRNEVYITWYEKHKSIASGDKITIQENINKQKTKNGLTI